MPKHPIFALAYGCLGFVRAMMTWVSCLLACAYSFSPTRRHTAALLQDKADMEEAQERLTFARTFVSAFVKEESTLGSLGRMVTGSKAPTLTGQQLESLLILSEAHMVRARVARGCSSAHCLSALQLSSMLKLTEESVMAFVKAGLNIRSAWKLMEKCYSQVAGRAFKQRVTLARSVPQLPAVEAVYAGRADAKAEQKDLDQLKRELLHH